MYNFVGRDHLKYMQLTLLMTTGFNRECHIFSTESLEAEINFIDNNIFYYWWIYRLCLSPHRKYTIECYYYTYLIVKLPKKMPKIFITMHYLTIRLLKHKQIMQNPPDGNKLLHWLLRCDRQPLSLLISFSHDEMFLLFSKAVKWVGQSSSVYSWRWTLQNMFKTYKLLIWNKFSVLFLHF